LCYPHGERSFASYRVFPDKISFMWYIFPVGAVILGLVAYSMVKKQNVTMWQAAPASIKVLVWLSALLNPIFGGVTMYYILRKNYPEIAKKANSITFVAFGIWIVFWIITAFVLSNT